MSKKIDITGRRFGRLVVQRHEGYFLWKCLCDCGNTTLAVSRDLRMGRTASCGCKRNEGAPPTHGMYGSPTYASWSKMKQRCLNPNTDQFKHYGAAGVRIHPPWLKFKNFLADMGVAPKGHRIDRIDPFKGYTPKNCRWAPKNTGRRRTTPMIGKQTLAEAAKATGLKYHTAYARFKKHGRL